MTRDDIIRMAQEAHQDLVTRDYPGHVGQLDPWTMRLLERFHALAVAAEREACARIVDANAAVCANNSMLQDVLRGNAAAIRARGQ